MYPEDRIAEQLQKTPLAVLTGEWVLNHRKPIVYLWLRGEQCLYVGQSAVGIVRPISPNHHRLMDIAPGDRVVIFEMTDAIIARRTEARLIRGLGPSLNGPPTNKDGRWIEPSVRDLQLRRQRLKSEVDALDDQIRKRQLVETKRRENLANGDREYEEMAAFGDAHPDYLSPKAAAIRFRVSEKALRHAVDKGFVKCIRVARRLRFDPKWVAEWAHNHKATEIAIA